MPGRRFWIIAASLSLTVAAMAAEPARKASAPLPGQPNIEADSYASEEGGKVVVATNAQLRSNDSFLSAKKLRLDYRTGVIVAEGEVTYATKSLRILGAKVTIDPRADVIEATDVRFGRSPSTSPPSPCASSKATSRSRACASGTTSPPRPACT